MSVYCCELLVRITTISFHLLPHFPFQIARFSYLLINIYRSVSCTPLEDSRNLFGDFPIISNLLSAVNNVCYGTGLLVDNIDKK